MGQAKQSTCFLSWHDLRILDLNDGGDAGPNRQCRLHTRLPYLPSPTRAAAIKTPYLPNGKFDLEAYDQMVEHQIQVLSLRARSLWPPLPV